MVTLPISLPEEHGSFKGGREERLKKSKEQDGDGDGDGYSGEREIRGSHSIPFQTKPNQYVFIIELSIY